MRGQKWLFSFKINKVESKNLDFLCPTLRKSSIFAG
jgi:hypothetical protein